MIDPHLKEHLAYLKAQNDAILATLKSIVAYLNEEAKTKKKAEADRNVVSVVEPYSYRKWEELDR